MDDITYCNRDCVNYDCFRNIAHKVITNYAFYGDFSKCEEYKGKEDERQI